MLLCDEAELCSMVLFQHPGSCVQLATVLLWYKDLHPYSPTLHVVSLHLVAFLVLRPRKAVLVSNAHSHTLHSYQAAKMPANQPGLAKPLFFAKPCFH